MIETHGLTHLSLAVADVDRSLGFYRDVFDVREAHRDAHTVEVHGPGPFDILTFEKNARAAGHSGGIAHFYSAAFTASGE